MFGRQAKQIRHGVQLLLRGLMHSKQCFVLGNQGFVLACQCSFLLEEAHTRGGLLLQPFLALAQIRQQLLADSTQLF